MKGILSATDLGAQPSFVLVSGNIRFIDLEKTAEKKRYAKVEQVKY